MDVQQNILVFYNVLTWILRNIDYLFIGKSGLFKTKYKIFLVKIPIFRQILGLKTRLFCQYQQIQLLDRRYLYFRQNFC